MPIHWVLALVIVGTSVASAVIALLILSALPARRQKPKAALFDQGPEQTVFLFDDDALIDASDPARSLLAAVDAPGSPWTQLCAYLSPRFPDFEAQMARLAERGRIMLVANAGQPLTLQAEWRDGLARITLVDPEAEGQYISVDRLSHGALEAELASLRQTMDRAPVLVWRQVEDGTVTWANRAYLDLARILDPEDGILNWPLPQLFEAGGESLPQGWESRRAKLMVPGEVKARWFECHGFADKLETLLFALPSDAAVQAEVALREFIQTLTKTFAHLPIGLAIFDRQRQLALFNPALIDLTALGPDFLTARPTLFAFLDRLHDNQRIPEPKDYKSWRQQISALEKAASSGQYEEIWTLPTSQTYRVTVRPHPDGAIALLLEDISAEVSLTRRFRAELEMSQAVFDSLPEALAVFSPAGILVMSNAAYAQLWGMDPSTQLGQVGISDALRHWQATTAPTQVWVKAHDYVCAMADRLEWRGEVSLLDGRRLACRLAPVQGGSTLIGFTEISPASAQTVPRRKIALRRVGSGRGTADLGEQSGILAESA